MKAHFLSFICFILSINLYAQNYESYVPDQLILKLKAEANFNQRSNQFNIKSLDELNANLGSKEIRLIGNKKAKNTFVLTFNSPININHFMEAYSSVEEVLYAEPNYIRQAHSVTTNVMNIPDDENFEKQWGLYNDGSSNKFFAKKGADISMRQAWEIEQGSPDVVVAILDTGVKTNHPEFYNRMWVNTFESIDGLDEDLNGYTDDRKGWNFAYDNNNPIDDHGHGTVMAGLLGANANNGLGFAGVDWNCKIMSCKVLSNNGFGRDSWFIDAIHYATDNGADIINMSIGGPNYSQTLEEAVDYAYQNNTLVIASSGNADENIENFPASYPTTLAVGSTSPDDSRASPFFNNLQSGSNYGSYLDVVAPGNYIYGLNFLSNIDYDNVYAGTSLSVPLVAGVASLLLAQNSTRTPEAIKNILISTADDQVGSKEEDIPGYDIYYGHGRINAFEALSQFPTSVIENDIDPFTFNIHPNPSSDRIFVEGKIKGSKLTIYSNIGQEILKAVPSSNSFEINVTDLPAGTYIIQIIDESTHSPSSQKFIVR